MDNKLFNEFDTYISYPFPLENGKTARLYLPLSITKKEVKRIIKALDTLVIKEVSHE